MPCSAAEIHAIYITNQQVLKVTAKGECPDWYIGPFIEQDEHWVGGLKFSLRSYAGGLGTTGKSKPFQVEYPMPIHLPSPVINSKTITFQTADSSGPGYDIKIDYAGLRVINPEDSTNGAPDNSKGGVTNTTDTSGDQQMARVLGPKHILVEEGKDFHITASFDAKDDVNIQFNPSTVQLKNASIHEKLNIVWTFEAKAKGTSVIEVTTTYSFPPPAIGTLMKMQEYEVVVIGVIDQNQ